MPVKRRQMKGLHNIHLVFILVLLASGLGLYIKPFRTQLTEWNFPTVFFHVYVSYIYIIFGLIAIWYSYHYAKKRAPLKKFNVSFNITLFCSWTISGLVMNVGVDWSLPAALRNVSVVIHDWTTFIAVPWILIHSAGHLFKKRIPWPNWWRGKVQKPEWIQGFQPDRRVFLKSGILFLLALFAGGAWKYFSNQLTVAEQASKRRGYFRIYNVTDEIPEYNSELDWKLTIDGLVNQPATLTMRDMRSIPWHSIVDDFHYVTGWSVKGVELRGIYVKDLFAYADIQPEENGQYVTTYSADTEYFDSFTLSQLVEEEAMLIFELDGQPLKQAQGFPCRLYHPDMYGYKSVKWLNRLTFTEERERGYWQQGGDYDLNGYL